MLGIESILKLQTSLYFLRWVITVVLSNNNNKLMVHMYIVKNTTIFLIVRLLLLSYNYMFRQSMLAIFRLYMKHLTISYIYTWVWGGDLHFVGWDGCEISFCVCKRGVDRVYLGVLLKYLSYLLLTISIGYTFLMMCFLILETILTWIMSKV